MADESGGLFGYGVATFRSGYKRLNDTFADIRPYRDDELRPVLERLLNDRELLLSLARFRLGAWSAAVPWLVLPLVRRRLRAQLRGVTDIHAMQMVIKGYMERMMQTTTAGFSVSGLDALPEGQPYLFMSNHRDITLDPAFTNYALNQGGRDTGRIAIGDNLLSKPWISDLMRLNKSFIVQRSARGPRQILKAYRKLSAYIRHSLLEERATIWIAQREGRAKNGIDRTEPAIIKMLAMSKGSDESMADYIASLRVVPVAISYELDPCDGLKAAELAAIAQRGSYEKAEHEDVHSIAVGISGNKGHVHVAFGTPLGNEFATPDAVAQEVDRQIIAGYRLHPSNLYAWEMLHGEPAPLQDTTLAPGSCDREAFSARIAALPAADREYALTIYANSLSSKLAATP